MEYPHNRPYTADDLVRIITLLRDPVNGCPWDKVQTHTSIRMNFLEEAYEAVDALDLDDPVLMCEELGDVLMQVAFHTVIEEERGRFDFEQVCRERGARLHQPDFSAIVPGSFSLEGQSFSYGDLKDLRIPLAGEYQMKNAAVVLETVKVLQARGWRVTEEHIRRGLANTRWPARFEVLQKDPVFIAVSYTHLTLPTN